MFRREIFIGSHSPPPSDRLLRSFSVMCPSSSLPSVISTGGGVVEAGSPGRAPTGGGGVLVKVPLVVLSQRPATIMGKGLSTPGVRGLAPLSRSRQLFKTSACHGSPSSGF
jgi:hypothetical protein